MMVQLLEVIKMSMKSLVSWLGKSSHTLAIISGPAVFHTYTFLKILLLNNLPGSLT